jgi:mutator family transposase
MTSPQTPLRIIVADDQASVREGLALLGAAPAEELPGRRVNPLCRQRMRAAFEIPPLGHIPGRSQVTRELICSTNAIESLNARYRRAVKARGHFPTELAALKCLYLVTRSLDPAGTGQARWTMRWKPALNAFAITFADRFPAAEAY